MSIQLIIGLVIAGLLVASHWYAYESGGDNRENAIRAEQAETAVLVNDVVDASRRQFGIELAERIQGIQVVQRTINRETQYEIREKPVYLNPDCAVPASTGVVLLNAARRGELRGARPGDAPAVPGSPPVRRDEAAPTR